MDDEPSPGPRRPGVSHHHMVGGRIVYAAIRRCGRHRTLHAVTARVNVETMPLCYYYVLRDQTYPASSLLLCVFSCTFTHTHSTTPAGTHVGDSDCVGGVLARSCSGADLRQPGTPRRVRRFDPRAIVGCDPFVCNRNLAPTAGSGRWRWHFGRLRTTIRTRSLESTFLHAT